MRCRIQTKLAIEVRSHDILDRLNVLRLDRDHYGARVYRDLKDEAILMARQLRSDVVLHLLADLLADRRPPDHIRSDNGPEFTAKVVRAWLGRTGVKTLFIKPGSPWENGYNESFSGKLCGELLNGEIYYTLKETNALIDRWRQHYNTIRPYSSLGYRPPAPETVIPGRPD